MTYTWRPSRDYLDHSNVARLMRTLGVTTAAELRDRSVAVLRIQMDPTGPASVVSPAQAEQLMEPDRRPPQLHAVPAAG